VGGAGLGRRLPGVGVMVGFLFGIPRTLQSEQAGSKADTEADAATPQQGYAQRVNTNLEQISDWLTKILVGLGLTQLGNVPARLGEAAAYVASGMPDQRGATVFAGGMIVYFSIVGFIGGYLFTRLFLARLFWAADVWGFERRFARIEGKVEETKGEVKRESPDCLIAPGPRPHGRSPQYSGRRHPRLEALRKDFGGSPYAPHRVGPALRQVRPVRRFHRGAQLFPGGKGPPRPRAATRTQRTCCSTEHATTR